MIETFLVILIFAVFIASMLYSVKDQGCGGDCYQGRRECNCKGKK